MNDLSLSAVTARLRTQTFGRRIVYRSRIGSTQDLAREMAEAGAPEGTAVLANGQTAGRGRLGRSWVSPVGRSIHLSLIVRPSLVQLPRLTVIAPLAVALAVEETTSLRPRIKWPNDVFLSGRKFAGVLIDSELAGDQPLYAIVGIGVNVNLDTSAYPEIAPIATSLMMETGQEVAREAVLASLLNCLEDLYLAVGRGEDDAVYEAWRDRLDTIGQTVRVRLGDQVEEGLVEDVDAEGSLMLRRADGSRVTVPAGEVTLRDA